MDMRDFLVEQDKQFQRELAALKDALGGIQEALKTQGDQIAQETAQAVQASGRKAVSEAQASLDRVAQAAQKVGELAQKATEATERAAKQSGEMLGRLEQASQRMVTSEEKVETALNELVPKVTGVRTQLEKELADVVNATAATEAEVKRMVENIKTTLTKVVEEEIKTKLGNASDYAADRIYSLGAWWENFHRIGIYAAMAFGMLATGICGWWYGNHRFEEGIYEKKYEELKANTQVIVWAHKFFPGPDGEVKHEIKTIDAPLVWLGGGKLGLMTLNRDGQWVYEDKGTYPQGGLTLAEAYDRSRDNKNNTLKAVRP